MPNLRALTKLRCFFFGHSVPCGTVMVCEYCSNSSRFSLGGLIRYGCGDMDEHLCFRRGDNSLLIEEVVNSNV